MTNIKTIRIPTHRMTNLPVGNIKSIEKIIIDEVIVRDIRGKIKENYYLNDEECGVFIKDDSVNDARWCLHFPKPELIGNLILAGYVYLDDPIRVKVSSAKNVVCGIKIFTEEV